MADVESRSWIGGEWAAQAGEIVEVHDPSEVSREVGLLHLSEAAAASEAVEAARYASAAWDRQGSPARAEALSAMAAALERDREAVAALASQEMGKPITEMRGEVARGVQILRFYAAEGVRAVGEVIPHSQTQVLQYTTRRALGVVGIITPWNFPVAIPLWKIAPALLCGNTVVWKPAESASLTAARLAQLAAAAGLPAGVLNLVVGRGSEVGQALVEAAPLDGLSFTGSTATGMRVAAAAAARNIKYQVEMGGKNAAVVLNDADVDLAVSAVVSGAFRSAGQKCTATSRIIVQDGVYGAFCDRLRQAMRAVRLGPALHPDTYVGPLASEAQFEKVSRYAHQAARATVVAQAPVEGVDLGAGYFVPPTVVTDVAPGDPLVQEEIFGPLAAILRCASFDEAVALCNQTVYGLSAAVFTRDLSQGLKFLDAADAGMVRVNQETAGVEYAAPFGGLKQSGSHSREQGTAALDFYSHTKTCAVYYGP